MNEFDIEKKTYPTPLIYNFNYITIKYHIKCHLKIYIPDGDLYSFLTFPATILDAICCQLKNNFVQQSISNIFIVI